MKAFKAISVWLVLLVVLPLALLAVLECGLRLGHYGHPTRLFIREYDGSQAFLRANGWFYQQFLGLPLSWTTDLDEFDILVPEQKLEREFRVFVFGGSTALGDPDYAYSFWRVLDMMLREQFPEMEPRIYCVAYPGMNSHVMRAAALACADLSPDLFLVYMGNNEFIGPYAHRKPGTSIASVRRGIFFSNVRMIQAFRTLMGSDRTLRATRPSIEPIHDEEHTRQVYADFEANLRDMVRIGADAGATTLLCTVPTNLRNWAPSWIPAPLAYPKEDALKRRYNEGVDQEEAGRFADAAETFKALAVDTPRYGHLSFRLARCLYELGQYEASIAWFTRARDEDPQRIRADGTINEFIRAVAQDERDKKATLVDVEEYLAAKSPHGVIGQEFFWDYVHTTFAGNYQIAAAIMEQIIAATPERLPLRRNPDARIPMEQTCAERLGLSPAAAQDLWLQMAGVRASRSLSDELGAQEAMRYLCAQAAQCGRSAGTGTLRDAYERALSSTPNDFILRYREVQLLLNGGSFAEALLRCKQFVRDFPLYRCSRRLLGVALAGSGQTEEARGELEAAANAHPEDWKTLLALAQLQWALQDTEGAIAACDAAIDIETWCSPDVALVKAQALKAAGQNPDAADFLSQYITRCPEMESLCFEIPYARLFQELDALLLLPDMGHRQQRWADVATARPSIALSHYYAAESLRANGDGKAADTAYQEALRTMQENEDGARAASAGRTACRIFAEDRLAKDDWLGAIDRYRYMAPRTALEVTQRELPVQLAEAVSAYNAGLPPLELSAEDLQESCVRP